MPPVLQLEGVVKKFRSGDAQVHVLVDFDFTLDAGEFVTGPSGVRFTADRDRNNNDG